MESQLEKILKCPICFETMKRPIIQCETGHSMCGGCIEDSAIKTCRQCSQPITKIRNYQLEQMIESMLNDDKQETKQHLKSPCVFADKVETKQETKQHLKSPCVFADKGCKEMLTSTENGPHVEECKYRKFICEGRKFAKWKCEWFGTYKELETHFKEAHNNDMEYKMHKDVVVDLTQDHRDVQIISFFNGSQYFWYKHMVDVTREKVYWTFQYIGRKIQAQNYYYEFEIIAGPIRKFKVTEICDNDVVKAERLFKDEKCVVLSFNAIKNYLNDQGKLTIKFRIMHIKKHNETSK